MTKVISLIIFVIMFESCTVTTTRVKSPTFNKPTDSIQVELNRLVNCEGINLDGKEISVNKKINSELEIDITNGKNIPADENQMIDLGKQIAMVIKNALQDKNEYDTYKVLFVTKEESGGVTRRNWKGKIFKLQEL
jgi:hypothetical protein